MGRKSMTRLAQGVYGRWHEGGGRSIQVSFTFRDTRCRETLTGLDPGNRNHVKYAANTRAAIVADIARNTFNYLDYFPDSKRARIFGHVVSKRTVRDVAEAWLADVARSRPHSTLRSYRGPCKRFIYPAIGDLRIRDVSVEHLRSMFREADISLKTARNYSIPLRAIFERAIDDDDIDRNPMDRINVKTLIPLQRHQTTYLVDPFDTTEIAALLSACRAVRPKWLNYWTVAFYTGLRTSELYGLQWDEVFLKDRTLHVERAIVERKEKPPKTRASRRSVDLRELALEALRRQRGETRLLGPWVFRNPRNGEPLADYQVSERAFDAIQKAAGVRRRNQYQTRHTYASNMLSSGEVPAYVAQQLGHDGPEMVYRVYGKWVSGETVQSVGYGMR